MSHTTEPSRHAAVVSPTVALPNALPFGITAAEQDELLSMVQRAADGTLSRRGFVALAAAIGAGQLVASQLGPIRRAFGAAGSPGTAALVPGGAAGNGNIVTIFLNGGNDGLNTLVPVLDAEYHRLRPSIKLMPEEVLSLGSNVPLGLHPALVATQARYLAGRVAVIAGIGYNAPNLSHFSSRDHWEAGFGARGSAIQPTRAGWLGRWLDTAGAGPFSAITFRPDDVVPRGVSTSPLRLRVYDTDLTGAPTTDPTELLSQAAMRSMAGPTGLGQLANDLGATLGSAVSAGAVIAPNMANMPSGLSSLSRQMIVAARLLNAGIGARVITTSTGGYDTHQDQARRGQDGHAFGWHGRLMADVDASVELLFATMTPAARANTTVLIYSEFGRRVEENGSAGTDHGSSGVAFVVGDQVNGGIFGQQPSLTALDSRKNMVMSVDFRSVYATLISRFLGGDDVAVIGASHERLLLSAADAVAVTTTTSSTSSTSSTTTSSTSTTVGTGSTSSTSAVSTTIAASTSTTLVPGSTSTTSPGTTSVASSTTPGSTTATTTPSSSTTASPTTLVSVTTAAGTTTLVAPTVPATTGPTVPGSTAPGSTVASTLVGSPSTTGASATSSTTSTTISTTTSTTVPSFPPPVVVPPRPGPGNPSDADRVIVATLPPIPPESAPVPTTSPADVAFDPPVQPDTTKPSTAVPSSLPSQSSTLAPVTTRPVGAAAPGTPTGSKTRRTTTVPKRLALKRRKATTTTTKRSVKSKTASTVAKARR